MNDKERKIEQTKKVEKDKQKHETFKQLLDWGNLLSRTCLCASNSFWLRQAMMAFIENVDFTHCVLHEPVPPPALCIISVPQNIY